MSNFVLELAIYFLWLVILFLYFYFRSHFFPRRRFADSLLIANGGASLLYVLTVTWWIPVIFLAVPIYPDAITGVNIVISIFDGAYIVLREKPQNVSKSSRQKETRKKV